MKVDKIQYLDIVLVDFGSEPVGSEQGGVRPAVIFQNDLGNKYSPNTIALPITSKIKKRNLPTHVLLNKDDVSGLTKDSVVLAESIKSISKERVLKHLGKITSEDIEDKIWLAYMANAGKRCR